MSGSTERYDAVVVGSGIAGLFTALRCAQRGLSVAVVTKAGLEESNTRYAQGGIAAALFPDDSPDLHAADTLAAGAGLCDPAAVRVLCDEAPGRIADLLAYGVGFDRTTDGADLARGLEGAHSVARILHAGGDATGARIEAALAAAVRSSGIDLYERRFVTAIGSDGVDGIGFALGADAVVIASGGAGQVYRYTTNPEVATGDGVAAAFRAGALVADAEFMQFHPTALDLPGAPTFLISEAVRGEGAVLRDARGHRFMPDLHPMAELAPRDVVARAIAARLPVTLDVTALDPAVVRARFPVIDRFCRDHGVDITRDRIPVTPAAHYWMGGILTNLWGETSLPGVYACGEAACSGVHGANRLASNSLLEGIVFGARIASRVATGEWDGPADSEPPALLIEPSMAAGPPTSGRATAGRDEVRAAAWDGLGLTRTEDSITRALAALGPGPALPSTQAEHEAANLWMVARLIGESALRRQESRGAHYRSDFPQTRPEWARRTVLATESAGAGVR